MFKLMWMPVAARDRRNDLASDQALKNNTGQIYETESAYNYIQVAEQNGYTILRLNEGQGVHSIYHPDTSCTTTDPGTSSWSARIFMRDRKPSDVKRIAIVGLAAGTTARADDRRLWRHSH